MRLRFAPSPTGFLHLGGLRTALFNHLLARKSNGGKLIVRIEDTDRSRLVPGAADELLRTLKWAGIQYDEGPDCPNPQFGPYIQSERLHIYAQFADEAIQRGFAYRCFCPRHRLEALKSMNMTSNGYDGFCQSLSASESSARARDGLAHVIRFKLNEPEPEVTFQDEVYGMIKNAAKPFENAILMKSDGFPTYHFANVIDDRLMQISLVLRGSEWIPSTPLHVLLYRAFAWNLPRFAHLPLLLNSDGSKLSKRQDSAHVAHYIQSGHLPSALNNFVAFLGWTPNGTREVFHQMQDLIDAFTLENLNSSDAVVNLEKLKWFNREHLKLDIEIGVNKCSNGLFEQLKQLISASFPEVSISDEYLLKTLKISVDRLHFPADLIRLFSYFFRDPDYHDIQGIKVSEPIDSFEKLPKPIQRLVLTGSRIGPSLDDIKSVLGPEAISRRLEKYKEFLSNSNLRL